MEGNSYLVVQLVSGHLVSPGRWKACATGSSKMEPMTTCRFCRSSGSTSSRREEKRFEVLRFLMEP